MPSSARGIVFTGPREVALEDFVLPDPGPQQALLRLTRTLVSAGTEVSSLLGPTAPGPSASPGRWPVRPGYSSVGVVEAVGQGVRGLAPGDRVLTGGRHASHVLLDIDSAAPAGPPGTRQNPQRGPHFAVPIPPGVSDEAAAFAVLGAVALHGFRKVAFQPGESCAVMGLGVVGQLLVQLARAAGARPVVGIDLVPSRLERARRSGAHAAVDATGLDPQGVERAVLSLTGGRGADVSFEATRTPAAFPALMRIAALGGRVVVVGSIHATAELRLFDDLQRKELTLIGAWQPRAPLAPHPYARWTQAANRALFLEQVRDGALTVEHLITHRARPEEAPALYAEMAAGAGDWMGVEFVWD
ncbi:MAG TPA: zinc-binding alcohol dehydrogenase [Chloroflexota bacterium]|nr:zinc-binding alcohol dehydrogenase [Chloroflexota bacterium]